MKTKNIKNALMLFCAIFVVNLQSTFLFASPNPEEIKQRNAKEKASKNVNLQMAKLEDERSFTFILYGDPQSYNKKLYNRHVFELMTGWTFYNKDNLKIKAVLCTGDIVEYNDRPVPPHSTTSRIFLPSRKVWEAASQAFKIFDNELPYILTLGNHDYGYKSAENRNTEFPKYFYPERNSKLSNVLVEMGQNYFGKLTLENAAYEFSDKNWGKILVLVLEFAPSDRALKWAGKILHSDKYKNHKVIVLTHSFLAGSGKIITKEGYKMPDANWAAVLWDKLLKDAPNVKMVISGHSGNFCSYREEMNNAGKSVKMMMFNPQFEASNGGDGWLRIMEFMPDGKTISMRTFSALFAASPETAHMAWRKGEKYEFKVELDY